MQNRKLVEELRALRENWGKETQRIRRLYDGELGCLRQKLEETENEKGFLEIKLELLEGDLAKKRDRQYNKILLSVVKKCSLSFRVQFKL